MDFLDVMVKSGIGKEQKPLISAENRMVILDFCAILQYYYAIEKQLVKE